MNTFCGIVYERTEEGRVEVLVTIQLARLPALYEHDAILDAYAKHYLIERSKLKLSVCAMIPDPRLHDVTTDGKLLFRGGNVLSCHAGDEAARQAGFVYAEELVKHLSTVVR